jgi:hypothetical protein
MKIVIADGAFDGISEEEKEEIIAEIKAAIADGSFFSEAEPVDLDQLAAEDPEAYEKLLNNIDNQKVEGEGQTFEVDTSFGKTVH